MSKRTYSLAVRQAVLGLLEGGPKSRKVLAAATSVSERTFSNVINSMLRERVIRVVGVDTDHPNRRGPKPWVYARIEDSGSTGDQVALLVQRIERNEMTIRDLNTRLARMGSRVAGLTKQVKNLSGPRIQWPGP